MKSEKRTSGGQPRTPTLEDVARAAGLSPMTVSRALNNPQLVRASTIEKVKAAVSITGYIPNMLAGGLASRRSKLIAVVVPQINNAMFVDTIQAISDALEARGYHMLLCVAGYGDETETDRVSALLSRRPDGVVLTGIHHAPELRKIILNAQIPVVEIWDLTPTPLDMLIGFSHEKIGAATGEYLLRQGHTRFALIWAGDRRAAQRKKGLYEVIQRQPGCHIDEIVVPLPASMEAGRAGLRAILAQGAPVDAVVCSSDTLAQGAIMEAMSQGITVPEQLAVMGFGDLALAAHNVPSITTIGVDSWKMGQEAATLLADKIEGKGMGGQIVDIGFTLIERESA